MYKYLLLRPPVLKQTNSLEKVSVFWQLENVEIYQEKENKDLRRLESWKTLGLRLLTLILQMIEGLLIMEIYKTMEIGVLGDYPEH